VLPFFIVLFVIGFSDLFKNRFKLKIIASIILISLLLISSLKLSKKFRTVYVAVDKSISSLREVPLNNIKEPIYTEGFLDPLIPYWIQNWTGYFIYDNSFSHWPTKLNNSSSANKVPDNSLILSGKHSRWYYPPKRIITNIIWENEYYKIGRICNSDPCLKNRDVDLSSLVVGKSDWEDVFLLNGWSIREGDQRWANEKESTLRLVTKESSPTSLNVEALSLTEPQEMTVYINDKLLGTISIDTEWKNYSLPINYTAEPGVHKIKFIFKNGYKPSEVMAGNLDNRILFVNFRKIGLE
jgi:hypothetical protein